MTCALCILLCESPYAYIGLLLNIKIMCVQHPAYVGAREGPSGAVQWPGGEEESEAHCTYPSLEHCWIYAGYIPV